MKTFVTVRRPDGTVEEVQTARPLLSDRDFRVVARKTKAAGRGECLSWRREIEDRLADIEPLSGEEARYANDVARCGRADVAGQSAAWLRHEQRAQHSGR